MNSSIKYFGGKGGGLGQAVYKQFPTQSQFDTYIEPFGGGASMLFIKEPYGAEIYNDLEENVYSFFKVLSDKSLFLNFKEKCDLALYSRQIRGEFIADLKTMKDMPIVERAYKFFIVNRTSINGIGGFSITSNYIRRGMSKSVSDFLSSIEGLRESHDRFSRVIVEHTDGIELIEKHDRNNTFIYADPPYNQSTRTNARYKIDMDDVTQKRLINTLLNIKNAMVLLSGYDCDENKRLEDNGWIKTEIKVNTISGDRKPKTKIENLWKNYARIEETSTPERGKSKNKTHNKRIENNNAPNLIKDLLK